MSFRVDRFRVKVSRAAQQKLKISDTLAFVEDGDFLLEFEECGLTQDDLDHIQCVITVSPDGGEVVPVTENIRDIIYCYGTAESVVIRYVFLGPPASTVLLLTAYFGDEAHPMTLAEAEEAERYVKQQFEYFSTRHTR